MCRQGGFGIIGIVLLLSVGCSSSAGRTSGPDGSAGAAGSADAATSLREAGASDVSVGGKADAGASNRATEVCVAALKIHVERIYFCSGQMLDYQRFAAGCPDYYFGTDSTRSVDEVEACLPDLASQPCSDLQVGLVLPCIDRRGKRPAGAGCAFISQCQSWCNAGTTCGTCAPAPVPLGEKCNNALDCEPGAYCEYNFSKTCMSTAGITRMTEGEACDLGANPAILCTGDLTCLGKKCTKPPVGSPCGDTRCPPNMFCKNDGAQTCADGANLGQPCSDNVSGDQPLCRSGLLCLNGKCTEWKGVGSSCNDADPCGDFLQCVSGACQLLNCAP